MTSKQPAFLRSYPQGVYRTEFPTLIFSEKQVPKNIEHLIRGSLDHLVSNPSEGYLPNTEEFFQRWLNGRIGIKPHLDHYLDCPGFELQTSIVEETYKGAQHNRLRGLVLASDLGYSSDFGSDVVFVINDLSSKKVLTFGDEESESITNNPTGRKLLESKPTYLMGNSSEPLPFPFSSLNPFKSSIFTWTLVNIHHQEVYTALRKIGFVW